MFKDRGMAALAVAIIGTAAAVEAPSALAAPTPPSIEVLSNRADLISAGGSLVAIGLPAGAASARGTLGSRDVSGAFARRPNGRYEGLVTGLALGDNGLTARVRSGAGAGAKVTIVDHPNGGPVFS